MTTTLEREYQLIIMGAARSLAMANFIAEYSKYVCSAYRGNKPSIGHLRMALDALLELDTSCDDMDEVIFLATHYMNLLSGDVELPAKALPNICKKFMSL